MFRQNLLFILGAFLLAAGVTLGLHFFKSRNINQESATQTSSTQIGILVASESIPSGETIKRHQLKWKSLKRTDLPNQYIAHGTRNISDFIGAFSRKPISKGQAVVESMITRAEHGGYLSTVIQPNMRAVSIPIDSASGVAGFIFPGDHVDVLLTHSIDKPGDTSRRKKKSYVSETILSKIKIIALDQQVNRASDKKAAAKIKTVTLEVTPKEAEALAVARSLGKLSLSLHGVSKKNVPNNTKESHTFGRDISSVLTNQNPANEGNPTITIIKGKDKKQLLTR